MVVLGKGRRELPFAGVREDVVLRAEVVEVVEVALVVRVGRVLEGGGGAVGDDSDGWDEETGAGG